MQHLVFVAASLTAFNVGAETWYGTAFAIGDGYTYITNDHVTRGAESICFRTPTGVAGRAKVISTDKSDDLSILRGNLYSPPLSLGTAKEIEKGMSVLAIGYPVPSIMGLEAKVTEGIVNALSGAGGDRRRFQISASIQPGNSGGPLLNESGRVVGVVVSKLGKRFTEITGQVADSVAYGINIAILHALIDTTPPLPQYIHATPSKTPVSKTKLISQVEPSVVLVVASDRNEKCADDFDVDIPAFGTRAKTKEVIERERRELDRAAQLRIALDKIEQEKREKEAALAQAESDRKRRELDRAAQLRIVLEKIEQENREKEAALAQAESDRKRREELAAKENANKQQQQRIQNAWAELTRSYPSLNTFNESPSFYLWQNFVVGPEVKLLSNFDNLESAANLLKNFAQAVGVPAAELSGNLNAAATDKILGYHFLSKGEIRKIDLRYGYGVGEFNNEQGRITHVLLKNVTDTKWQLIPVSKIVGTENSKFAASFNISPSNIVVDKLNFWGVDIDAFNKRLPLR